MNHIKIATPDIIIEKLLTLLTEQLPELDEHIVLLDAVWMNRVPEFPGEKIILFLASADPGYLESARKTGAAGFWYLQPSVEDLSRVLAGEAAFSDHAPIVELGKARSTDFTKRELDVLRQMVEGKSDAQIGDALSISMSTVKHHVQQLFFKTGFSNRTQLAVAAVSCGLIQR